MTKSEIICLLRNLRPAQIKDIVVVYHNPSVGLLFMDFSQILVEYARFKLSLYRLRRDIKYVSVVCSDEDGNVYSNIYFDEKFPVSMSLYSYLKYKNKKL